VCNLFLVTEPLAGWRHVMVSGRAHPDRLGALPSRTWSMSTTRMPSGSCWSKTTPNTHTPASLYAAFAPAEAKRLAERLELHYTPGTAAG
jgi:hypothetical protein